MRLANWLLKGRLATALGQQRARRKAIESRVPNAPAAAKRKR